MERMEIPAEEIERARGKGRSKPAAARKPTALESNYDFYEKHYLSDMKGRVEKNTFSWEELDKCMETNPSANMVFILPLLRFIRSASVVISKCYYDKDKKSFSLYTESGLHHMEALSKILSKKKKVIDPFLLQKFSKTWWRTSADDAYKIRAAFEKGKEITVTILGIYAKEIRVGDGEYDTIILPRLRYDPIVEEVETEEEEEVELVQKKRKLSTPRKKKDKKEIPSPPADKNREEEMTDKGELSDTEGEDRRQEEYAEVYQAGSD